jgi:hypothetical protein
MQHSSIEEARFAAQPPLDAVLTPHPAEPRRSSFVVEAARMVGRTVVVLMASCSSTTSSFRIICLRATGRSWT